MEGDVPIFLSALSDCAVYQTFNKRSGNGRTIPRLDLRFFWKRPEKIDGASLSREDGNGAATRNGNGGTFSRSGARRTSSAGCDLTRLVSDSAHAHLSHTILPFFIGHFHKTSHAIASRCKFDYDESACARRACGFFSF